MAEQRVNGHTVSRLTVHIVWSTKYHYCILEGDIQKSCRKILIQICDSEGVNVLKGVISKDYVHMHLEYRPSQDISNLSSIKTL
ncbi:MAG: IS200/IS605 family transposase [Cellulophaga sp.]